MHIFRSGGGLRVVRVEKDKKRGKLLGYGEYCNVEQALDLADCELAGEKSEYTTEYLTGSSTPTSKLDEWVLCGYDTNFRFQNEKFVFLSAMTLDISPPKELIERSTNGREYLKWEFEGRKFTITPGNFPSGARCCTIRCVSHENYMDGFRYPINYLLSADTFEGLLDLLEEKLGDMDKFEKAILIKKFPYVIEVDGGIAIFSSKEDAQRVLKGEF